MAPRLGRVVAGAAVLRLARAEVVGVTADALEVAGDRDLAGLRIEDVTRRARLAADEDRVLLIVAEPRGRTHDVERALGLGMAAGTRGGHGECLLAVVAVLAILRGRAR